MTDIQPYQIVVVLAFLAVLFAVQLFVKFGRVPRVIARTDDRLRIVEQLSVGSTARLVLIAVDQEEFLVACPKQGGMSITPLEKVPQAGEVQRD